MEQRTSEWLEWRKGGIGSSDAPIIMGVSPWKTPYQLWEEKTGRVINDNSDSNWAIERGNRLEPAARSHYETVVHNMEKSFLPVAIAHEKYPMLRASMDGVCKELNGAIEIKCPGKADHEKAAKGEIPEKYYWQLQHQLNVGGYDWIDYVSYDGSEIKTVRMVKNEEDILKLLEAEFKFWDCVIKDTPPPLSDRDYKKIVGDVFRIKAMQFKLLDKQLHDLKKLHSETKQQMLDLVEHPRAEGYGIRIIRFKRKGNVDYSKIPELKDVNLNQYRKPMTEVETLEVVDA